MLFKDFINENMDELKSVMSWENYDLNEDTLPVVESVKDHALEVLSNTYGKFDVDDILDEMKADIRIHFPALLQQLSITTLMIGKNVVKVDILHESSTRTERASRETNQNTDITLGTQQTEVNELNTTNSTIGTTTQTGTVAVQNTSSNEQTSSTSITNTSGVDATGNRNVNLSHSMPEQAIIGTGIFPKDPQGTPILDASFVQTATESFNTINPINTTETSSQTVSTSSEGESDSLTTNDLTNTQNITQTQTGDTTKTLTNSGTDTTESVGSENVESEVTESIEREATNAQYAYEIKAFLETTTAINAFQTWVNRFSWVCGIV